MPHGYTLKREENVTLNRFKCKNIYQREMLSLCSIWVFSKEFPFDKKHLRTHTIENMCT